jgi:hypothetical protein
MSGCTENSIARKWGGTMKVELKEGERLVNVTWKGNKDSSLWVLTKNAPNIPPTTYKFEEKSAFGVIEGTVLIIEK